MRTSVFRSLAVLLAILTLALGSAAPAAAGERERSPAEMKKIMKGLAGGIKALEAIGGDARAIEHMRAQLSELEQRYGEVQRRKGEKKARKRDGGKERQRLEHMIELMLFAHRVLREADRDEHAEIMEHGAHALKLILSGRKDEEAMEVLASAPSTERQVKSVLLAAEILADRGKKDQAGWLRKLAKQMSGSERARKPKADPEREREDGLDAEELAALRHRVEILRMAMTALREGEKRRAAEVLERAIHTGELMLAGRRDEEAREIYEHTPSLGDLAEILHVAAELWAEFKHPEKAEHVMWLSKHYAERARGGAEEREDGWEGRERELRRRRQMEDARERADEARAKRLRAQRERERHAKERHTGGANVDHRIEQLQKELDEVKAALHAIMKQLRAMAGDK